MTARNIIELLTTISGAHRNRTNPPDNLPIPLINIISVPPHAN